MDEKSRHKVAVVEKNLKVLQQRDTTIRIRSAWMPFSPDVVAYVVGAKTLTPRGGGRTCKGFAPPDR